MMKWLSLVLVLFLSAVGFADQSVYTDSLASGWSDYSWASVNFAATTPVHTGRESIAVTETGGYQAIYLHHDPQSSANLQALVFYINGGKTGGQLLQVQATLNGASQAPYVLPPVAKNTWTKVVVPLTGVGVISATTFDGFWIQDRSGTAQGVYYVDDISLTSLAPASVDQPLYSDSLSNSWTSGGTASLNFSNPSPVHSGTHSIYVLPKAAGDGLYLKHAQQDDSGYQTISFWINGGPTGGQSLQVVATASGIEQTPVPIPAPAKNTWQQVIVSLAALGVAGRGDFDGIWIADAANKVEPKYYIDDYVLSTDPPVNPLTTISIDASQQTAISPLIYGVNSTDWADLGPGFTFTRLGGNRLTAYNWENNASNAGSDYEYQNDDLLGATNEAGWTGKTFIQAANAEGATPLLTIPTCGYVAADKNGGGSVMNTPNWINVRFKKMVASKPGGHIVYPPVTTDDYVYADEYVHYIRQFGVSGHAVMFCLDNEPDLWSSTHFEIHPTPVTYAELLANSVAYSTAIKTVSASATVFGPVNYGWYGYRTLQGATDAAGRDFMEFYLAGMNAASTSAGKRLLDVLDLHWYPEATGDNQRITTDSDSPGLSVARIQASRSLWDPTYVEDSWITGSLGNKAIQLLPDTFGRIAKNYPGTKLAFTEYNYGGGNAISGALAQADVLGVFGRYGVYAAANWGLASSEVAELAGFQSFINYDRSGSSFAANALKVTGETASANSVYAAADRATPSRVTLVVINKTGAVSPFTIDFTKFVPYTAKAYTICAGHYTTPLTTSVAVGAGQISFNAPALSVTTIELKIKTP